MSNIIVATPEELKSIIEEAIAEHFAKSVVTTEPLPDTITLPKALELLENNGYPTSRAKIYKLTSAGEMPHRKYGNKLVFSRQELLEWADKQSVRVSTHAEAMESIEQNFKRRRR